MYNNPTCILGPMMMGLGISMHIIIPGKVQTNATYKILAKLTKGDEHTILPAS